MRKIISLGLVALMLSIFSGQLLAGKVPVCEDIKKDPAYKGLYGLCNAYWNADNENARAQILANFVKKAGPDGPGMPGLNQEQEPEGMECPCWAGVVLDDVDLYTPADVCYLNTPNGDLIFFGEFHGDGQVYIANGDNCAHDAVYVDESGTTVTRFSAMTGLNEPDQQACLNEIDDLANLYFDDGLECFAF